MGIAHGGIMFTLMDTCAALAAGLGGENPERRTVATLSMTINYSQAVASGCVIAESRVRGRRRTMAVAFERRSAAGDLLATALGTFQAIPPTG